jgi:RNA polymerase sigma factor (sigma-70 family)
MLATTAENVEQAFIRYRGEIYAYLLRRTQNHWDAEELTQQVFADAASALPPVSMRGWLFKVAERRFIDELRRRKRLADLYDAGQSVSESAETPQAVADAVGRLPQLQRQIVVLRVVERRTYSEIAHAVGCTEAACKMRLSRALRQLRDELDASSPRN